MTYSIQESSIDKYKTENFTRVLGIVENKGRLAAKNCKIIMVLGDHKKIKLSWKHGNESNITLNTKDFEPFDICSYYIGKERNYLVFPSEKGYGKALYEGQIESNGAYPINATLIITSENSKPTRIRIRIEKSIDNYQVRSFS